MPKGCCVVLCHNNNRKNRDLSFYMIPSEATEPERRRLWIKAIRRSKTNSSSGPPWEPKSDYTYVCSQHFLKGKKHNDPTDPDYVPSVFPYTPKQSDECMENKVGRYQRALLRSRSNQRKRPKQCVEHTPLCGRDSITVQKISNDVADACKNTPPKACRLLTVTPLKTRPAVTSKPSNVLSPNQPPAVPPASHKCSSL